MSGYDIDSLAALLENATPGPWVENGYLSMPSGDEADASSESDDWITFKTAHPGEDRALFIALANALPAMLADLRLLREAREGGALIRVEGWLDMVAWTNEQMEADADLLRALAFREPPT